MNEKETIEKSRKWIEAAKQLEINPKLKLKCPECDQGYLIVRDELIESWKKLDRYMVCDTCGKWNVMTMEIPENYEKNGSATD